jgi:hypothetical protein
MSAAQPTVIATSIGFQPDGGDTWRLAIVSSVAAVPGRMARIGAATRNAAALFDRAASRRISRR